LVKKRYSYQRKVTRSGANVSEILEEHQVFNCSEAHSTFERPSQLIDK
jgi:hypothetical protein